MIAFKINSQKCMIILFIKIYFVCDKTRGKIVGIIINLTFSAKEDNAALRIMFGNQTGNNRYMLGIVHSHALVFNVKRGLSSNGIAGYIHVFWVIHIPIN